jgi:spore coat protein A, manganese oxidase
VVIRHRNELPQPAVGHLHGGHTPHASDGYPTDLILPVGATGRFTAATVWRGLVGFHLIHDDEEAALGLPSGDRDIPLMITDRAFAADGGLLYPALDLTMTHTPGVSADYVNGVTGDVILVNGAPWPVLHADAVRYRLRILNASNARNYRLALRPPPPGGRGLVQIGSDGGLLAAPLAHDSIDIVPSARYDVVVDLSRYRPGTTVDLINLLGTGPTTNVMRIQIGRALADDATVPTRLSDLAPLDPTRAAITRTFLFQNAGHRRLDHQQQSLRPQPRRCHLPPRRHRNGDSSPTSTTRSTSISTSSTSSPATTPPLAPTTRAGKTPSNYTPPKKSKSPPASPTTQAATPSTATTSNTKTWP